MEQQKFNEQAALAQAAQQRLDKYVAMQANIDQRIADIEANANTSIFGKEFKQKMAEFKSLRAELDKEIKKEQKILEDFELLKNRFKILLNLFFIYFVSKNHLKI